MADKDFRVKNRLHVNGLTNTSGVILATNNALDSHTNVPTQYGGTGTTQSPAAGQVLFSSAGTTYTPTTLTSLDVKGATYSADAPANPVVGQVWIESDSSSDSFDPNIIRRKTITATAGQTTFTTDLEFIQGYEQVYFNGMLLLRTTDYTTPTNTSVELASAAAAGDIVEILSITNLNSINAATTTTNTFTGSQTITSLTNGNNFVINAPGGETPNFVIQGNGEQTFRFHNTNTTGSTRTSWKMASRINPDWSWIWYTDSPGNGTNDLTLANRSHNPAFYFDQNSNAKFAGSLATTNQSYAGKNLIINGAMDINQRALGAVSSGWICDRWYTIQFSGTGTWQQVDIPYGSFSEQVSNKAIRITSSSATNDFAIGHNIEDVTTFAGRTVNISFWIRSNMSNIGVDLIYLAQVFGVGGSSTVMTFADTSSMSYGTSWTKVNTTITLPSVSGKTIGPSNCIQLRIDPASGIPSGSWVEITHVQIELGQYPSVFSRHGAGMAGELAACQRYFERWQAGSNNDEFLVGGAYNTIYLMTKAQYIVPKRVAPTVSVSSNTHFTAYGNNTSNTVTSIAGASINSQFCRMDIQGSWVTGYSYDVRSNTSSAYIDFSAEL